VSTTNDGHSEEQQPRVVIRDRRRIDPETGAPRAVAVASVGGDAAGASASAAAAAADAPSDGGSGAGGTTDSTESVAASDGVGDGGGMGATKVSEQTSEGDAAKLTVELAERTADLQRVTAEYANYRRRVDRDRQVVAEQSTGAVLTALLPVLDDIDRARVHGDLTGPFGAVAEQLVAILTKLGLNAFGEAGDPFDPTYHEAVAHTTSPDVTETACIEVLRKGYMLGDRLLRAAMVAVADPAEPSAGHDGSSHIAGAETSGESSAE
jgi:molecular chaperone GrpE